MELYFGCLWFNIKIVLFFIISSPSLSQLRLAKQLISDKDSLSVKLCTGMAFNTMQEISNHISKKNTFSLSAQRLREELTSFIPQNSQYETLTQKTRNLLSRQVEVKEEKVVDKVVTIFVLPLLSFSFYTYKSILGPNFLSFGLRVFQRKQIKKAPVSPM